MADDDMVQVDLAGQAVEGGRDTFDRFDRPATDLRVADAPPSELGGYGLDPEWLGKSLTELDDPQKYAQPHRTQVLMGYIYAFGSGDSKEYGGVQFRVHVETIGNPPPRLIDALDAGVKRLQTLFDTGVYDGYMDGFNFGDGWRNVETEAIGGDEVHHLGVPKFEVEVYTPGDRELGGEALGDFDPWEVSTAASRAIDWSATISALEGEYGSQKALADSLGVAPSTVSGWKTTKSWGTNIKNSEHYRRVYGRAKRRGALRYDYGERRVDWLSTIEALERILGSQKALADAIGVTPRTVRGWKQYLQGKTDKSRARDPQNSPSFQDLRRLAKRESARVYRESADVVEIADEHTFYVDRDQQVGGSRFLGRFDAPPRIERRIERETEFTISPGREGF